MAWILSDECDVFLTIIPGQQATICTTLFFLTFMHEDVAIVTASNRGQITIKLSFLSLGSLHYPE
jgi:hypothetical protein